MIALFQYNIYMNKNVIKNVLTRQKKVSPNYNAHHTELPIYIYILNGEHIQEYVYCLVELRSHKIKKQSETTFRNLIISSSGLKNKLLKTDYIQK